MWRFNFVAEPMPFSELQNTEHLVKTNMSLWKIAWRSIQQRALASSLTAISMALGVMLVVAVLAASSIISQNFRTGRSLSYNLLVGAKGGDLQLVLNTVYHLSKPVENVPYSFYKEFLKKEQRQDRDGLYSEYVDAAIPVCMGDYYQEFRVVGTTPQMFEDVAKPFNVHYTFAEGKCFTQDDFFGAVVGSFAAQQTGLKIGSKFKASHGVEGGHAHADEFTVVGILEPRGSAIDKGLYINMEGFFLLEGHAGEEAKDAAAKMSSDTSDNSDAPHSEKKEGEKKEAVKRKPLPESRREVTAILLRSAIVDGLPWAPDQLKSVINKGSVGRCVQPILEIADLFNKFINPMMAVLFVMSVMVVIVSGIGILVSIYNSMNERQHEIAVMRALGASRSKVMLIVLLESVVLSLGGGILGWVVGHSLIAAVSPIITHWYGFIVGSLQFSPFYELILIPGLIVLASLVGFLPAWSAYRTDVAKSLTATP